MQLPPADTAGRAGACLLLALPALPAVMGPSSARLPLQACDPETGEPLACSGGLRRAPAAIYRGRSAKELTVSIIEQGRSPPAVTRLDHAAYLGRELQRAELALALGLGYEQD
jgi:hypothetical protein